MTTAKFVTKNNDNGADVNNGDAASSARDKTLAAQKKIKEQEGLNISEFFNQIGCDVLDDQYSMWVNPKTWLYVEQIDKKITIGHGCIDEKGDFIISHCSSVSVVGAGYEYELGYKISDKDDIELIQQLNEPEFISAIMELDKYKRNSVSAAIASLTKKQEVN